MLKKWINNRKVQHKMILIYAVAACLPMIILFTFCASKMNQILKDRETENIQSYLYQAREGIDGQLALYNNLSDYISFNETIAWALSSKNASNYEKYEQLTNVIDPLLSSIKYFHNDVEQATIYTGEDTVEHDTTLAPITEITGTSWYPQAVASQEVQWFVNGDKKQIFCARKMPMLEKNNLLGIFYLKINYQELFQNIEQNLYQNYGIFVIDSRGKIVYENSLFEDENQKAKLTTQNIRENKPEFETNKHVVIEKRNGMQYLFVKEEFHKADWSIIFYTPTKLIVKQGQILWTMALLTMVLVLVAGVIGLIAMSALISKRLYKLQNMMKLVEDGTLDVQVDSVYQDEIGDLYRGFAKMLRQINILIQEVYEGEIQQKKYEMKALQAQINPHFLYNSLSLINWKALEAEQTDISEITLALSTFYRTSLNKGKNLLKIEEELNNCKSYLAIQLYMHDYEFDTEYHIEEEILPCETINLILQPLVENAIEHGIELKEDGERGKIVVSGYHEDNEIYLVVEDNGVGMEMEKAQEILTLKSKGYGVRNVNERIKLQYGEAYGLIIESTPLKGTKITVRIPYQKNVF